MINTQKISFYNIKCTFIIKSCPMIIQFTITKQFVYHTDHIQFCLCMSCLQASRHNYYHSILSLVSRPIPSFSMLPAATCSFRCATLKKLPWDLEMSLRYSSLVHVCIHYRYLVSTPSAMTDQERDEIDSAAQDFIHSCSA